jgi:purine-cytosine permease-like protein
MQNNRSSLRTLRAISALFLAKLLKPIVFLACIILGAAYVLTILLSLAFSNWWMLALIILIPLTLVLLAGYLLLRFFIQKLLPRKLSTGEQTKIHGFLDTLLSTAERAKLPYPVIVFLVAKDVIRGKESKFLGKMVGDTKGLMTELGEIERLFRE